MSIRQKRTMTEASLEAHRRNARQSRGPVSEAGKRRLRDANISHGFYAQDGGAALEVLGEDPREYQQLAQAVAEKWRPADTYEEQLGTQLARALWRARRSDRMQEGLALRLAQNAECWREDNLHARLTMLSLHAGCLRILARDVGQPDYRTTPRDMEMLKSFQAEGVLYEMGAVITELLITLEPKADAADDAEPCSIPKTEPRPIAQPAPADASQTSDPAAEESDEDEDDGFQDTRRAVQNLVLRQAQMLEEQRAACLRELIDGPSPFERAAEFASAYSEMKLLQRFEDSSFRQVWRLSNLFIKLKGGEPERKAEKMTSQNFDVAPAPAATLENPPNDFDEPAATPEDPATEVERPEAIAKSSPTNPEDFSAQLSASVVLAPEPPPASTQSEQCEATGAIPGVDMQNEDASGKVQSNQYGDSQCDVLAPLSQRQLCRNLGSESGTVNDELL